MDAEFWVFAGFLIFVALAAYFGIHSKLGTALDSRGSRIKAELAEAERLRQEAADVLASFESKRAAAEGEAARIVEQAKAEADLIATEAQERLAEFISRRTAQAEAKIATAEHLAMAQVKSAAADAATAAAEIVLKADVKGPLGETLLTKSLADVKRLAH